MRIRDNPAAVALALALLLVPARAWGIDPVNQTFFGVAIRGYDPVAYFDVGRPERGRSKHSHEWMGATWRFASAERRDRFAADPERYAPRYGGYCAYAVSQGTTAPIDPEAWKIVDGRLYLNKSPRVQELWEQDVPGHIARADANWPRILAER